MKIDESIWRSAQNLFRSQENLNKLFEAFDGIICQKPGLVIEGGGSDDSDGEWLQPVWNAYYSVKPRSHKKMRPTGWITLAVQLTCDEGVEALWEHGRRAKVLAGFCPLSDFDAAWGFDTEFPNSAGYYKGCVTHADHWLFEEDNGWFFAVPLDALTSTESVQRYIISPIQRVIGGEKPDQVLSGIRESLCLPPPS